MNPLPVHCPTFILVDPTGVVRATGADSGVVRAGDRVEHAIGIEWQALVDVVPSARSIETPKGRFRLEPLYAANGAIDGILVALEEAPSPPGTIPPSSSPRIVADLAIVAGRDPAARAAVDLALRFGKTMLPVYVAGEEGSGVEALAMAIVKATGRQERGLVHVHAGALSPAAIEQHLAAAYASTRGGTLYIEDAHELDVAIGRRLAREIDRGELAETHVIATGAADLRERALRGTFASELYTLVRSSTVTLPPLRDREDFEFVARQLAADVAKYAHGGAAKLELGSDALRLLRAHGWPGNLRELRAWIERAAAAASPERTLHAHHFPTSSPSRPAEPQDTQRAGLRRTAERAALEEALRASGGNVSLAAKKLGVARSTLYRMKLRYKLEGNHE